MKNKKKNLHSVRYAQRLGWNTLWKRINSGRHSDSLPPPLLYRKQQTFLKTKKKLKLRIQQLIKLKITLIASRGTFIPMRLTKIRRAGLRLTTSLTCLNSRRTLLAELNKRPICLPFLGFLETLAYKPKQEKLWTDRNGLGYSSTLYAHPFHIHRHPIIFSRRSNWRTDWDHHNCSNKKNCHWNWKM